MTHQGLRNLFDDYLAIDDVTVYEAVLPIWSLTWIVRSWADGLRGSAREEFLGLRMKDLLEFPGITSHGRS
jgi:hypothetical protein